jgi:gliding motility-associated-like protein
MKKLLLLKFTLLLLLLSNNIQAQFQNDLWIGKQAYNWYFYDRAGLNFETRPPIPLTDGQISGSEANEGSSAISDDNGNLLFYTNGLTIWNRNHQVMVNGDGLLGDLESSSTQSSLIVQDPGNDNRYYVFVLTFFGAPDGLTYSIVDMTLDGGLGAVTNIKNVQLETSVSEKMTAVYHSDKDQIWLINHKGSFFESSNGFRAYRISREGLITTPIISNVGEAAEYGTGQLKASPDGSKLAMGDGFGNWPPVKFQVFDFNTTTGEVTNPIDLSSALEGVISVYGVEFSPNNRFVYIADSDTGAIIQFDLLAGNQDDIASSAVFLNPPGMLPVIDNYPSTYYGSLQLAPDGKIYIAQDMLLNISVINYPNNKGVLCDLQLQGVEVKPNRSSMALPGFVQSYFESGILHEGECANEAITFSTIRIPGITSITWNFGDTASGANNISTDIAPSHTFTSPGTYRVTATIISNGAEQTTETDVIITAPSAVIPQVPPLCADSNGSAVFNLSQLTAGILNGQDAAVFSVAYFASATDVASNTPIATPDSFTTSGQDIHAQVTNSTTGCKTTIQFNLRVNTLPIALNPANLEQCGIAGTATFNLTMQDAAIQGSQDAGTFKVSYFANAADVQANTPISNPAGFTASAQQVYAVVTNIATGCSSSAITFNLIVTGPAIVAAPLQLEGCSPVNLAAVTSQLESNADLSFYANEQHAVDAFNAIAETFSFSGDNAIAYVRAENTSGCAEIYKVEIRSGDCTIPRGISPNNDGLNDSFDLSAFDVKQLSIYNRYGQQVYSRNNYNSEWHGQADNDNELPTGTYYYFVEQGSGEQKTGWVYVNREVN